MAQLIMVVPPGWPPPPVHQEVHPLPEFNKNRVAISEFKDKPGIGGKYSAYCSVCLHNVYQLWVAPEDHGGKCPYGHTQAHLCAAAMAQERTTANIRKALDASVKALEKKIFGLLAQWVSEAEPCLVFQRDATGHDQLVGLTAEGHDKVYVRLVK